MGDLHHGDGPDDRLRSLEARLKRAREESRVAPPRPAVGDNQTAGLGMALRIGIEMVAGVGLGAGVGYLFDRWFGTSPWLLIVFFFLGAGAGGLNTFRAITGAGFGTLSGPGRPQDVDAERGGKAGHGGEDRDGNGD